MQRVTEKMQDNGGIRRCYVSLSKIYTRSHGGNFSLQEFFSEYISKEIDVIFFYPDEDDINESKLGSSEIQEQALSTTKMSNEDKLKQLKHDLICNLKTQTQTGGK